jgi:CheY-like chemotaxis protein
MSKILVLIVDDEPIIRMDLGDMVRDAGYEVLEANDADEAVRLLEVHDAIRILVTDIEMPGSMDGLKLAAAVRERWPPVVIIVTSGRIQPANTELPSDTVFLGKPYDAVTMSAALDTAARSLPPVAVAG